MEMVKTLEEARNLSNDVKAFLAFSTCAEYAEYLDLLKQELVADIAGSSAKECIPKDGMTLQQFGALNDYEKLIRANEVGRMNDKSNPRVMYAAGYGFNWESMKVAMFSYGFIMDQGTNTPSFHLLEEYRSDDELLIVPEVRMEEKKEFRYFVEAAVEDELVKFLAGFPKNLRGVIISAMLKKQLSILVPRKQAGEKVIKFSERYF